MSTRRTTRAGEVKKKKSGVQPPKKSAPPSQTKKSAPPSQTKKPTPPSQAKKTAVPASVDKSLGVQGYKLIAKFLDVGLMNQKMPFVFYETFAQVLETKFHEFRHTKRQIKSAINKDFGDSKKPGTPQRVKPMAAIQKQIKLYKEGGAAKKKSTAGRPIDEEHGEKKVAKGKISTAARKKSALSRANQPEEDEELEEDTDSDDEEEDDEEEEDDDYDSCDDIDEQVRYDAIRRATACPQVLKQTSFSKANASRKSSLHTISEKMKGLAIADKMKRDEGSQDSGYDEDGEEETEVTIELEESGMNETVASPHSFHVQSTPYPKKAGGKGSAASVKSGASGSVKYRSMTPIMTIDESIKNYDLNDLSSGDETDNEDHPRKPVPSWAQVSSVGPVISVLRELVGEDKRQQHFGRIKPPTVESLFGKKVQQKRASRKKQPTAGEEPSLAWASPLADPRSAHSRYQEMLEEVKLRNAGSIAPTKHKK